MRLCIFGTRSFYDNQEASRIIDEEIKNLNPSMIITAGDADGICRLAIEKAKLHSIPCELHFLNRLKYAQGMYHHRSLEVIQSSDFVLFIHNGESKGTKNEIELAKKIGKACKYYKINDEPVFSVTDYETEEFKFDFAV